MGNCEINNEGLNECEDGLMCSSQNHHTEFSCAMFQNRFLNLSTVVSKEVSRLLLIFFIGCVVE
eukprot:UN00596